MPLDSKYVAECNVFPGKSISEGRRVELLTFSVLINFFFRCDLFIIANDKKEKIASGLLTPFFTHLRTAQEQIAKGGYSILLEPDAHVDDSWFTKGTVERFVQFCVDIVRIPVFDFM